MHESSSIARAAILTVSDGVAHGAREDETGAAVVRLLDDVGFAVVTHEVVADDVPAIVAALEALVEQATFVVTNGGTGLGPRDVTPEATRQIIDREVPGLAERMRAAGRASTPMADLSRAAVGAVGTTLVVNLPGSPAGAVESLDAILSTVPHALDLLAGHTRHDHGAPPPGHGHDGGHDHKRGGEPDGAGHRGPGHDHGADSAPQHQRASTLGRVADPPLRPADEVVVALADRVRADEPAVLATVLGRDGDPPSAVGRRLLVDADGPVAGTLGCSEFDTAVRADARSVLATGAAATRTYRHDLGTVTVHLEPFGLRDRLVAVGATPVARWLVRWARDLGYATAVVDRRGVGWDGADQTADRVADVAVNARTDVVHTDHDAPGLVEDVTAAVTGGARFIGIVGSRRHTAPYLDGLRHAGLTDEQLDRIQSPVGFKIGSEAAEIALGILAGVVAARR